MARDYSKTSQRYADGIGRSGPAWLDGIMSLSVNPAAKAGSPEGMSAWLAGVQQSVAKRKASLARVSLQDIQSAAQTYGQSNYTNSQAKAKAKYDRKLPALQALWNAQHAAVQAIAKVPGTTNQARWAAAVNLAMAAKGRV